MKCGVLLLEKVIDRGMQVLVYQPVITIFGADRFGGWLMLTIRSAGWS